MRLFSDIARDWRAELVLASTLVLALLALAFLVLPD